MGEERISLSQRERERLTVLQEVDRGRITQVEAASRLRLSARQVRQIERRVQAAEDRGVVHRLRGRRSNRKIPAVPRQNSIRI